MPFGIPSQKGGVHFELVEFLFSGGEYFCWLELVEFRLYLSASHCIFYLFSSCHIFVGIFMLGGVMFVALYVSCFQLFIDLYL